GGLVELAERERALDVTRGDLLAGFHDLRCGLELAFRGGLVFRHEAEFVEVDGRHSASHDHGDPDHERGNQTHGRSLLSPNERATPYSAGFAVMRRAPPRRRTSSDASTSRP